MSKDRVVFCEEELPNVSWTGKHRPRANLIALCARFMTLDFCSRGHKPVLGVGVVITILWLSLNRIVIIKRAT